MPRHEIPTHLEVEDKVLGSLTVRQMLFLAVGVSISYGLWGVLSHLGQGRLPVALELILAAIPAGGALVLALSQPDGRPFEEWLLAHLRYASLPKICVWRPLVDKAAWPLDDSGASSSTEESGHGTTEGETAWRLGGGQPS